MLKAEEGADEDPEGDRERFTALVPEAPLVEVKPMLGSLGAFVNGNTFMGFFGSDVAIKLLEGDQQSSPRY